MVTKKKTTNDDGFSLDGGTWGADDGFDIGDGGGYEEKEETKEQIAGRLDEIRGDVEKTNEIWKAASNEANRFTDATDSEFYICLVFRDREAKEEYIRLMEAEQLGDKYVDGHEFAKLCHIQLEKKAPLKVRGAGKRWRKLAMD